MIKKEIHITGLKPQSVIEKEKDIHSKKPEIVYEIIEKMYPRRKYIELFARNKRKNWEGWGDEYGKENNE